MVSARLHLGLLLLYSTLAMSSSSNNFEPHLQIIPLKRVRTRGKPDDAMRGERDVLLVHNLPHTHAVFRDTVHLDGLPEDLILLMRFEFFHVLSWENWVS